MRTLIGTASILAALALAGCGSNQSKKTMTASAVPQPLPSAPATSRVEPVKGEVRDAMLALRRVHFGLDNAIILPDARTALVEAAERLRKHPDVHIYIDGHTDARGTSEYNIALGDQRARVVATYLARSGIAPERLHALSFGDARPIGGGHDATAYAMDRRADFRLMRGDVRLVVEEGVLYDDRGQTLGSAGAGAPRTHR